MDHAKIIEESIAIGYRAVVKNTDHVAKLQSIPSQKTFRSSLFQMIRKKHTLFEEQPKVYSSTKTLLQDVMISLPEAPPIDWLPQISKDTPANP